MPDFFRRTGLLPGAAYVVGSNAPAATIRQANILKARYGDLIGICDGVDDQVEIQASATALAGIGGPIVLTGIFVIGAGGTMAIPSRVSIYGLGATLDVTALNADVFQVAGGGSWDVPDNPVLFGLHVIGNPANALTRIARIDSRIGATVRDILANGVNAIVIFRGACYNFEAANIIALGNAAVASVAVACESIDPAQNPNGGKVHDCYLNDFAVGVRISGGGGVKTHRITFEGCGTNIQLLGGNSPIIGPDYHQIEAACFGIDNQGCLRVTVMPGTVFHPVAADAVAIRSSIASARMSILGCTMRGNNPPDPTLMGTFLLYTTNAFEGAIIGNNCYWIASFINTDNAGRQMQADILGNRLYEVADFQGFGLMASRVMGNSVENIQGGTFINRAITGCRVLSNYVRGNGAARTVRTDPGSTIVVEHNDFRTMPALEPQVGDVIRRNEGYVTENTGTAQIAPAGVAIAVNHLMNATPIRVIVSPRSDPGVALVWWVSAIGAAQFTINVSPATVNALDFDWRAVAYEGS